MFSFRLKIVFVIFAFIVQNYPYSSAQEDVTIENLIENIGEETYSSPELDIIEYYKEYPMNLRDISAEELSKLPGISLSQAISIIEILSNNPNTNNRKLAELSGLSGAAEILLDNCTINEPVKLQNVRKGLIFRSRFNRRIESSAGYEQSKYIGNADDIYSRFLSYYSDYEICGIVNKNAGEPNLNEFNSGYARYDNGRSRIIAGDFSADYGMGSLLWRQFAARKGTEVIKPVIQLGNGISPYRSTIDFAYFRGLSAQTILNISNYMTVRLSGFYSSRDKSSTIDSANMEVSSIYTSGYYRTQNEISKKDNLHENAIGSNIEFLTNNGFTFGTTLLNLDYSIPINSSSSSAFRGKNGTLLSAYSIYRSSGNMIGAEISLDALSNKSIKAGYVFSGSSIDFAFCGRYIESEFRSPYGFHFGEFSSPANEKGLYTGILLKLSKKFNVSFYTDVFSSLSSTYLVPGLVRGMEFFADAIYNPDSKNSINIRIRNDNKTDLFTNSDSKRLFGAGNKKSIRFDYTRKVSKQFTTRIRAEYVNYSNEFAIANGEGMLSFIDVRYKPNDKLKFGGRYTLYSTDNFNSAVYQYEYNLPGVLQTTALYGDGGRVILFAQYSPYRFLTLQGLVSTTFKNNTQSLGSGYEMINSDSDPRFTLQIEFKLK